MTTSRSSLLQYCVDQYQDPQELVRVRALLAQKESENAALRQALFECQSKVDTYQDIHQTLRRHLWSLEAELNATEKLYAKRTDTDASVIQKKGALKKTTNAPIHHQRPPQPPLYGYNDSVRRGSTDTINPYMPAEETYKTAVSQVSLDHKKSESPVLGIHDIVCAIEEELAYLETPPLSSEDEGGDEDGIIKLPRLSVNEQQCMPGLLMENEISHRLPSSRMMEATVPVVHRTPQRPPGMPRQRPQSMVQKPSIGMHVTRRNSTPLLTVETMSRPQTKATAPLAEANATVNRLMMQCQKQQDARRRRSAFLGSPPPPCVSQQQQQHQQQLTPSITVSEQWKISGKRLY